jgi:hypothetical protein
MFCCLNGVEIRFLQDMYFNVFDLTARYSIPDQDSIFLQK